MTALLDELARSLAKPMPRRRALRVVAAATVGAWLQGSGSLARAGPGRAQHICDTRVSKEGWKYCTPASEACFPTCCPSNWACCKGKCGDNGCCEMACCNPCNPESSRCVAPFVCGRGPTTNCCPGGRKHCGGETCCEPGAECADADLQFCCKPREKACKGGKTVDCCRQANEFCCSGKCCPRGTRCKRGNPGTCKPCPKDAKKCGKTCCIKGETCCNGKCCSAREKCCPSDICCKKDAKCCGEQCCSGNKKCCGDHCCSERQTCCDTGCCNEGTTCLKVGQQSTCCPDHRVVQTPGGKACCDPGWLERDGKCCRPNKPCNDCDPPCRGREYCQDGFCVQP